MEREIASKAITPGKVFVSVLKLLRPKQWIKNGFVTLSLVLLFSLPTWMQLLKVVIGTLLFCLISSSVYVLNDYMDADRDRAHPTKKYRPIASGEISKGIAIILFCVLSTVTITASFIFNWQFAIILSCYFLMNIAYSLKLKEMVFIDVFIISIGFIMRLVGGMVILSLPIRNQLYLCFIMFIGFVTLFIGMGKRNAELKVLDENGKEHRKSLRYLSLELISRIMISLIACTIMTYILFVMQVGTTLLYLSIPILVYGMFRYEYLGKKTDMLGKPELVVFEDRPIRWCIITWILMFIAICIRLSMK